MPCLLGGDLEFEPMTLTATSQGQVAGYRPDIDGLRAVAVLAVVAFHAFPAVVPGGFAGVDVFFVISGFLISRIMFTGLERKDFSLETFFAHRIKRIFPALILVLLASFGIGWFTLLPGEFAQLGKHIAAGAGFVQNIALWSEAGYFDVSSELKPLMHLWSLAVEEQFYLVYPVMVLAAWRAGLKPFVLIATIGTASFLLNIWRIGDDPTEAFFLSHTRLWELLSGALLACMGSLQGPRQGDVLRHVLSVFGIALIGAAAFGLNPTTVFPGWWALLPVAGAWLLIYAGPQACVNRWLLGYRGMVWVGLISYPLYLWHWPLLTFLRISEPSPSSWQKLVAVGMAFVLAWLTYRLLERPIRFGGNGGAKTAGLVACLAIVGGMGFVSYQFNGLPWRFPQEIRGVAAYVYDAKIGTRMPACWLEVDAAADAYASECSEALRAPGEKRTVLVWGDSHAAGLYAGIQKQMGTKVAQFTRSACPPLMGVGSSRCVSSNEYVFSQISKYQPDTVVLFAVWNHYSQAWTGGSTEASGLLSTIRNLRHAGVKNIVVLGPAPRWAEDLPKILAKDWIRKTPRQPVPLRLHGGMAFSAAQVDAGLKALLTAEADVRYFSVLDALCNAEGCLTRISSDPADLTAWDYGHLTIGGAEFIARQLPLR